MAKNHKASSLKDEGSSESMDSSTSQDGINFQNYDGLRNNNPHLVTNSSNYNGYLGNRGEEVSESSLAFAIGNPVESPLSRLQNQLEHLGFSSNLNGTGHQGLLTSTPFGNFPNDLVLQVAHHHHQQQQQQQQQRRHQEQQQQQIKYQSSTSPSGTTTMTEGEWYKCHICPFRSLDNQEYAQHMGTHFSCKCSQCPYQSRTEGRLKRHIQKFHSENPPENWVTPQASSKNDDYSDNSNYDDGGDGPEGSGKSANGSKHSNGVKKARKHKCKQCPFVTTDKEELWEHIRIHMKPDKILSCTECKFITEYKHHLEYHIRNHFGSKPFTCSKCNYICVNKSMLNSHMKSHSNVYQYRCRDCSYATKYCHSLKLHLRKYKHEPATVLNLDGSPNPFPVIDVYGTRRGPRPKKKTPESKLTVSSNGNACNGSGSGSGGGPSATKTTTPPMTTFSSSPTAAPVASSAVPTSCNSQEVNAMISPFSQMMSNQQSAISPLNFLNNKGCIPSFISTLSPFFYPPFPNFPPGLVSSPHFGGLVSSQQHPPALQISPTTTVLPISTMRLPTTNTNTNTTSVLDGSNHSVPLPLPPPPLLPSPLSSPMSSPISPITPTAMITMDSTNNNSITLSSPKQTRKQSSHNSNTHIVPLKCSYCDLVFEKREDLYAAHLKTHIKKEREVAMKRKESESSSEKESESLSDEGSPAKETKISSEVAIWEQIRALLDKVKDLPTSRQVMCPEIAMAMNCINEKSLREYLAPSEEEIEEDPGDNDDDDDDDDDREMQIEQMDFKWGNESGPLDLSKRISSPGNKEGKASNTDRHRRRKGIAVRRVN